jgi:hypothetical protein
MARIIWKEGDILNIQLKENLYTIGLMHVDPYIFIFNIHNKNGKWENVDLDKIPLLTCVLIGRDFLKKLKVEKIKRGVSYSNMPQFPKLWLKPNQFFEGEYPWKNARLIEVDPTVGTYHAKVIKNEITIQDREIIENHELTNMWGAEDLSERLITFFETGRNIDKMKEKIFR